MIWAVYGAMFLLAGAIVLLPFYRGRNIPAEGDGEGEGSGEGEEALVVYRQQLVELERDLASGALEEGEADTARLEIHRRMLAASGDNAGAAAGGLSEKLVTGVALLVLVAASALYMERGKPGLVIPTVDRSTATNPQVDLGPQMGLIQDRLAGLEAKLAAEPDNLEGWTMLGRSYRVMGRTSDAADAYARAAALNPHDLELRLNQAELLVESLDGLVSPAAQLVFVKVQEIDPAHPAPGFYLGLAEYQNNNVRGALEIWQALEAGSPAEAPWLPALRGQIERAQSDLGLEPGS